MGKIGHGSEKVSPDHGVPSSQCPLKTGCTEQISWWSAGPITVKRKIIGEDLFGEIGELINFAKISTVIHPLAGQCAPSIQVFPRNGVRTSIEVSLHLDRGVVK